MPDSPFAPSLLPPTQLESHYRAHHGWLVHWLQRRLGNAFDAADLMQDTFLRLLAGAPAWADADALHAAMADPATRIGLRAIVPTIETATLPAPDAPVYLAAHLGSERIHTLGRWGSSG